MKVYKFIPPYDQDGNTNFRFTNKKAGVYIIKKAGEIVYVGYSGTNLYRTMYRHFQSWFDVHQQRTVYKHIAEITIRVIITTPTQAARLEKYLVVKYQPIDNTNKYNDYILKNADYDAGENYLDTRVTNDAPF